MIAAASCTGTCFTYHLKDSKNDSVWQRRVTRGKVGFLFLAWTFRACSAARSTVFRTPMKSILEPSSTACSTVSRGSRCALRTLHGVWAIVVD